MFYGVGFEDMWQDNKKQKHDADKRFVTCRQHWCDKMHREQYSKFNSLLKSVGLTKEQYEKIEDFKKEFEYLKSIGVELLCLICDEIKLHETVVIVNHGNIIEINKESEYIEDYVVDAIINSRIDKVAIEFRECLDNKPFLILDNTKRENKIIKNNINVDANKIIELDRDFRKRNISYSHKTNLYNVLKSNSKVNVIFRHHYKDDIIYTINTNECNIEELSYSLILEAHSYSKYLAIESDNAYKFRVNFGNDGLVLPGEKPKNNYVPPAIVYAKSSARKYPGSFMGNNTDRSF